MDAVMNILFWICWAGEMAGIIWWILSDRKLIYSQPNIWPFLGGAYLLLVLAIRYEFHLHGLSNSMVMLPAIPLVLYGLMIVLFMISGKKWN